MSAQPLPQHPLIAREGWPFIALAVAAALIVHLTLGWVWALPFDLIAIFVLQFFRDPARPDLASEGDVLSPADGRIVKVEKSTDPYSGQDALLISVFMNVFNVHSNRASVAGTVKHVAYSPGQFLNADLDKASTHNERNLVVIQTQCRGQTHDISLVQVAGLIARRILCYVKPGDALLRAQRYGFIRFGSRVDVYLPLSAKPCVTAGEKVHAATTILAQL